MTWPPSDPDWQMSILFLLALAALGFLMKLVALLTPNASHKTDWAFVFAPILTPAPLPRVRPSIDVPRLLLRTVLFLGGVSMCYWIYWNLVRTFHIRGILLGYLATPVLLLIGSFIATIITLLWLPSGRVLPDLHNNPLIAGSVAEFWGRRWNLRFSDWFRFAIFKPLRRHSVLAVLLVFSVSGLMHEWVLNVPLYIVTDRKLFGTMMLYFLLQAGGVLIERRFLKGNSRAKIWWTWLVVFAPAPLVLNEGLLRALHLWPT